mgnify:FL=1
MFSGAEREGKKKRGLSTLGLGRYPTRLGRKKAVIAPGPGARARALARRVAPPREIESRARVRAESFTPEPSTRREARARRRAGWFLSRVEDNLPGRTTGFRRIILSSGDGRGVVRGAR